MAVNHQTPPTDSPGSPAVTSVVDPGQPMTPVRRRLSGRASVMLAISALLGLIAFLWPLFMNPESVLGAQSSGQTATPVIMAGILAIVLMLLVSELTTTDMDVKALAMLGVLTAVGAAIRPLSAGTAGIETIFFLIILAGRVFGPSFGFIVGALTMFASAMITGGVGTWMPYQMLAAGFVGLVPGLFPRRLPRPGSASEIVVLCGYGFVAAFGYGYAMDFAFWPFAIGLGAGSQGGYDPTATPLHNIHTFLVVNTVTSLGWNLGRAITNVVLIAVLGSPLLRILRRTTRQAQFE